MKKISFILAIAFIGSLMFSTTASAGLFGRLLCCNKVLVDCEYTVKVPVFGDKECVRKCCQWVKDTKTISVCVDQGNWEEYDVTVPVRRCCLFRRCNDCCCECTKTITCKRWVPNIVTVDKEVPCWRREIVEETYTVKTIVDWTEETRVCQKWVRVPCCRPVCDPCPCAPAACGCN